MARRGAAQQVAVALVAVHCAGSLSAEAKEKALSLELMPEEVTVTQGEPILVGLLLWNRSDEPRSVDLGGERMSNLYIMVRSPHRSAVPGHLEGPRGGVSFGGAIELGPGEKHRTRLVLSRWFSFFAVGTYEATVAVPVGSRRPPLVIAAEDRVRIEVRSRDPEVLQKTCVDLADRAVASGFEARLAAVALSQVWDPVCLPSIERLFEESASGRDEAVIGLARVGTGEAIEILLDHWDRLDQGMRALAHWEFDRRGGGEALRSALEERKQDG